MADEVIDFTPFDDAEGETPSVALPPEIDIPSTILKSQALLSGVGGTGKSTLLRELVRCYPGTVLAATTGIASCNLGEGTTINALLSFFDTASLTDSYVSGHLVARLGKLFKAGVRRICCDEASMMSGEQLTIITQALQELAGRGYVRDVMLADEIAKDWGAEGGEVSDPTRLPIALLLGGDLGQLAPVKSPFPFESPAWEGYAANEHKLTKIWRQSDADFITALLAARRGDARTVVAYFESRLSTDTDQHFAGSTLYATNDEVGRFNFLRMQQLSTPPLAYAAMRWGKQRGDWAQVPDQLELKVGALVMILANQRDTPREDGMPGRLIYANGDLGEIVALSAHAAQVALQRNGVVVEVEFIRRINTIPLEPGRAKQLRSEGKDALLHPPEPQRPRFEIVGTVDYLPVRVAYASTVHKCVAFGTRVNVAGHGLLPIEEVRVGMVVLTGEQRQQRVLASAYTGQRELVLVRLKSGILLRTSKDHKLWTRAGTFLPPRVGLQVRLNTTRDDARYDVSLPSAVPTPRGKPVQVPNVLTGELAWLLGALVGDGCYTEKDDGMVEFHASSRPLHDILRGIIGDFGVDLKMRKGTTLGSYFISKSLRQWLDRLGLHYVRAEDKVIPPCIFQADVYRRAAFLRGLFDTDGSMNPAAGAIFATCVESVARGVQQLLLSVGVYSTLGTLRPGHYRLRGKRVLGKRPTYQVRVPVAWCAAYAKYVGFNRPDRAATLATRIARPTKIDAPYEFLGRLDSIVAVVETGLSVPMWDLEVEEDHRFVIDGVLCSNCQGLTLDAVQVNLRHHFFKTPSMLYVAFSRCRTAAGLRIVGSAQTLKERCTVNPKILPYL